MFIEFNSRCIDSNTKIFEDILEIRHQVHNITLNLWNSIITSIFKLANILSYKNYSEYALELCMAKKPENVQIFLDDLTEKLKKWLDGELDVLLKYKKEEVCIFSIIKEKIFYKKIII